MRCFTCKTEHKSIMEFLSEFYLEWRITLIGKNKFMISDKTYKIKNNKLNDEVLIRCKADLIRAIQKTYPEYPLPEIAGNAIEKCKNPELNTHLIEDWGIYSVIPPKPKRKITHPFKWTPTC